MSHICSLFQEQDVRPDERELGEIRPTTVNMGMLTHLLIAMLTTMFAVSICCSGFVTGSTLKPNLQYVSGSH